MKVVKSYIDKVIEKGVILKLDNDIEGIIPFKNLSKEERKKIKDILTPDLEVEATVQEIDEELRKIILMMDFSDYLNNEEKSDSENKEDDSKAEE